MNSRFSIFLILILFLTLISSNFALSDTARKIEIKDIIVKNNQRIDVETILSYLNLSSGDKVNYEILNKKCPSSGTPE